MQELEKSVRYIKGIGPKRGALLKELGIENVRDLLFYFPRRYEDRTHFVPLNQAVVGDFVVIKGRVIAKGVRPTRSIKIFELVIDDKTARLRCIFFNQAYLDSVFKIDDQVIVAGKLELYKRHLQINSPEYEIVNEKEEAIHVGRIVPVYPLTQGLPARSFRAIMHDVTTQYALSIEESLPKQIIDKYNFPARGEALSIIHNPEDMDSLARARNRIIFEEFFLFEVEIAKRIKKRRTNREHAIFRHENHLIDSFKKLLPFELTCSQKKVLNEILHDFSLGFPMNRLLQGEVGSGKTIVAFFALWVAVESCYQGALLVPTEILAEQQYSAIQSFVKNRTIKCALLTGGLKSQERKDILQSISNGEVDVVIGTHALIQKDVQFKKLGLIVIDEQHKFGVRQRAHLRIQKEKPHCLVMTATPIPRTLGLTVYGDLEISTLKELPFGQRRVKTFWITKKKESDVFSFVKERLKKKEQAFIVFPLVEETEKSDLKAATVEFKRLKEKVFQEFHIGLIHGKMDKEKKQKVMNQFRCGDIHLLVSTTVVEVGIDNPNASIIIIEDAERFGLSQLHQMRGRVGRNKNEAYCFLFGEPTTETGKRRLRLMTKTNDGFKIAEEDLYLRGPGEFLGTRQSGLPQFKMAEILRDKEILQTAKNDAFAFVQ